MRCKYMSLFFLIYMRSDLTTAKSDSSENPQVQLPHSNNLLYNPIFEDCLEYAPVLREQEPENTFVLQVKASIGGYNLSHGGGMITYDLENQPFMRPKFKVDNMTGVITTEWIFDRDEPIREHMAYLTVRATNNAHPQLISECTFMITIEDINDNAPVFDRVHYRKSIRKDMKIGDEVVTISATDIDNGNNSIIKYNMSSLKAKHDDYFQINQNTGVIVLKKSVADKKYNEIFRLVVTARDLGRPSKSSSTKVQIMVNDHHKNPTFTKILPGELVKIYENSTDFNATLFELEAFSNIKDEPDVNFQLVTRMLRGRIKKYEINMFRLEMSKNRAVIKLSKMLDYESVKKYKLTIRVSNNYNLYTEENLMIEVLDVNDNVPIFRKKRGARIYENEPAGIHVMQVQAIDADKTEKHNQVTYQLGNHHESFAINKVTGEIISLTTFDKKKQDSYHVEVIASDNSPSALLGTGEPNKSKRNFLIEILTKKNTSEHVNRTYIL